MTSVEKGWRGIEDAGDGLEGLRRMPKAVPLVKSRYFLGMSLAGDLGLGKIDHEGRFSEHALALRLGEILDGLLLALRQLREESHGLIAPKLRIGRSGGRFLLLLLPSRCGRLLSGTAAFCVQEADRVLSEAAERLDVKIRAPGLGKAVVDEGVHLLKRDLLKEPLGGRHLF